MENFYLDEKLSNGSSYSLWKGRDINNNNICIIQKILIGNLPNNEINKIKEEVIIII